jgi:hypothetical protein
MPITYEPIATTTLSSTSSSITFSSIPSTYTDLRLIFTGNFSSNSDDYKLRINSDSGTNYSSLWLRGDGTSASQDRTTATSFINLSRGDGMNTSIENQTMDIFSYTGSTFKSMILRRSSDRNGSGTTEVNAGMWMSTSAVTSINIFTDVYTFAIGTTATLYGILKA